MTAGDISTEDGDFDPQQYQPRYAVDAVKLRLFNATREEMSRWFGVQKIFLDIWATLEGAESDSLLPSNMRTS